jgi:hypothetical protein
MPSNDHLQHDRRLDGRIHRYALGGATDYPSTSSK